MRLWGILGEFCLPDFLLHLVFHMGEGEVDLCSAIFLMMC